MEGVLLTLAEVTELPEEAAATGTAGLLVQLRERRHNNINKLQ